MDKYVTDFECIAKHQKQDPDLSEVFQWVEMGARPRGERVAASSAAVRHYWNYFKSIEMDGGVLYKRFCKADGTGSYLQLSVPRDMRQVVMQQMHNSVMAGHLGGRKTLKGSSRVSIGSRCMKMCGIG